MERAKRRQTLEDFELQRKKTAAMKTDLEFLRMQMDLNLICRCEFESKASSLLKSQ
jgi:hypothetical protein